MQHAWQLWKPYYIYEYEGMIGKVGHDSICSILHKKFWKTNHFSNLWTLWKIKIEGHILFWVALSCKTIGTISQIRLCWTSSITFCRQYWPNRSRRDGPAYRLNWALYFLQMCTYSFIDCIVQLSAITGIEDIGTSVLKYKTMKSNATVSLSSQMVK